MIEYIINMAAAEADSETAVTEAGPSGEADPSGVEKTPPKYFQGLTCIGEGNNCNCPRCKTWPEVTDPTNPNDGEAFPVAPNTDGVTEMEFHGRWNIAEDNKKRNFSQVSNSPARAMETEAEAEAEAEVEGEEGEKEDSD